MTERPDAVPEEAEWSPSDNEWILAETDSDGQNHGLVKYWRPDGTLCCETEFVHGTPHGDFRRFHENGDVSREGEFVQGALQGTNVFFRCEEPSTENFPAGLGDAVWRAEMDFEHGNVVAARAFDRDGERCLEDGTPFPDRPQGVPERAHFDEEAHQWVEGSRDDAHQRVGTWRWWSADGVLSREVPFVDDEAHGEASFYDEEGELDSKLTFHEGMLHGPAEERVQPGYYRDESAVLERGSYHYGEPTGSWAWFDADGQKLGYVVFGAPRDEHQLMQSPAFADERREASQWRDVARECKSELRYGEMLVAATRAASVTGRYDELRRLFERMSKPLSEGAAGHVFNEAEGSLEGMLGALIGGAPAPHVLRQMAVVLDQREVSVPAWDLVNAAVGLAPEATDFHFTRALVGMSVGEVEAARASADALAAEDPGRSEFVRTYIDLMFHDFGWFADEEPSTYYDSLPEVADRSLDDIRETIQKYATRLRHIRDLLVEAGLDEGAEWMIPDMDDLLPDGPVELGVYEVRDEEGDSIPNDETLDMTGQAIPTLMRAARAEWSALCWLCWAAGLDEVALPDTYEPRPDFGQAAGMASQRLWRCRDREVTGGQMAAMHEVPSFEWEGMPIDEVPGPLVGHATFQYAEMQALFYYLSDPNIGSPWQEGLRGS